MTKCKNSLLFLAMAWVAFGSVQASAKTKNRDNEHVHYISHIGDDGYTIHRSGVYRFTKNLDADFDDNGTAAITITASNVVLDLNQYTLSQDAETSNNIGVLISPEVGNVTIKNGNIEGFSGWGVVVAPLTSDVTLNSLFVTECGWNGGFLLPDDNLHAGGILFDGMNNPIWDVQIENCRLQWNGGNNLNVAYNGLAAVGAWKMRISDSTFSDNWVFSDISMVGAEFFWSDNITIENCHFDDNWIETNDPEDSGVFGVLFNTAVDSDDDDPQNGNIAIYYSTANENGGESQEAGGFAFYTSRNIVIENCEANQIYNTLDDTTGDTTLTAAAGFIFYICDDFDVNKCQSYNNRTEFTTQRVVGGFDISASNFGVISNSEAAYCFNQGGTGILAGFIVEPTLTRDDFIRNTGIIFENCISEYNLGDTTEDSTQGGGFFFARVDSGKILNCEAIFNRPSGIVVGLANGVANNDTINSFIKDNIVFSNSVNGIIDITANATTIGRTALVNAYLGNFARSNGATPSADNYVLPAGNAIVAWNISAGNPSGSSEETDNVSIF